MNAYGSERRMCLALGVQHLDDVAKEIENLFKLLSAPKEGILDKLKNASEAEPVRFMDANSKSGKGECQEIVMHEPDITKLPVITCWPKDGGPFVTSTCYSYKRSEYRYKECWNV
jgi:4-hydroxy-3-polyprenylbenzoate decarboxylase